MALRDHFQRPLSAHTRWSALLNAWATRLAADLNGRLPERFFAEPNVQFGIEIDVAACEDPRGPVARSPSWQVGPPLATLPFSRTSDVVEVRVFGDEAGPVLVGAIELVSPSNKDPPEQRSAFVSKCDAYLQRGVGLVIVDVVTSRRENLHRELLARFGSGRSPTNGSDPELYAAAYHGVEREGQAVLDLWEEPLALGAALPTVPLWLRGLGCLPVELQLTYEGTARDLRLPA